MKKYELGDSLIPQKYREMMALATAAAMKCPYCQTFHKEVAKMYGATEAELNELAAIVAQTSFWSAILHYDMSCKTWGHTCPRKSNEREEFV
jgi:AhpD family alkylhydroperoxidase